MSVDISNLFDVISARLAHEKNTILAIDGMAAAGKSTLAAILKERYSCNVIPMDHFFLRPEQRTPERFSEPGGNVDYERFITDVVYPLSAGKGFCYMPYDCGTGELSKTVDVVPGSLTVIEGVYCMHPIISSNGSGNFYDISVFMQIDEALQRLRIQERNPDLYERFFAEWIPMENIYFSHFDIKNKCTYVLEG